MSRRTRKAFRLALAIALGVGMIGATAAAVVVVDEAGGVVRAHDPVRHHSGRHSVHDSSRGWLGIVMDGTRGDGTVIRKLVEDGPAAAAGLREGDRIRAIDDVRTEDYRDITNVLRKKEPGDRVSLEIDRDGERMTLDVTLGERPRRSYRVWTSGDEDGLEVIGPGNVNVIRLGGRPILGVDVHEMSDSLRDYFRAPDDAGVLVNRVIEESPAERAGLQAGDVIVEVEGRAIRRVGDISRALRSQDPGDTVAVVVIRDRNRKTLDVTLDERDDWSSLRELKQLAPNVYSIPSLDGLEGLESLDALGALESLEALQNLDHLRMTDEQRDELRGSMRELRRQMQELREQMKDLRLEFREKSTQLQDSIRRHERIRERARPASYDI